MAAIGTGVGRNSLSVVTGRFALPDGGCAAYACATAEWACRMSRPLGVWRSEHCHSMRVTPSRRAVACRIGTGTVACPDDFHVSHPQVCPCILPPGLAACYQIRALRPDVLPVPFFSPLGCRYPFRERVQEVLRIPEGQALDVLHEITEWHTEKNGNRISAYQKIWNSDRDRTGRSLSIIEDNPHFEKGREVYARFEEVYRDFIAEVVAPGMGGGKIQYQRAPTIRIMVPASCNTKPSEPTTPLHCDMDYHHQSSELNFWLPLTSVWDTNSLWVESSPGRGDFNAPAMEYGQCSRFYGNKCRHFTKPNLTGKTRVSLDFRAVSSASGGHDPTFRKGRRRGAKARFQDVFDVGGYYEELAVPPVALVMQ